MKAKLLKKIFVVTTLLGMLASTTASGSDLKLSLDSSGPPKIEELQKILKRASSPRKPPASMPTHRTTRGIPLHTPAHTKQPVDFQKTQAVKPHAKLGWRFLLKEQPLAAMAAYREALRKNPRSAKAYLGLGISLKSLGKVRLAKKALLKAVNRSSLTIRTRTFGLPLCWRAFWQDRPLNGSSTIQRGLSIRRSIRHNRTLGYEVSLQTLNARS